MVGCRSRWSGDLQQRAVQEISKKGLGKGGSLLVGGSFELDKTVAETASEANGGDWDMSSL